MPSRVNSRSGSSCGTLRRIGMKYCASSAKSVEPLLVPALVEQLGLVIEELLDLLLQEEPGEVVAHAPRSFQLAASMNWRQRA